MKRLCLVFLALATTACLPVHKRGITEPSIDDDLSSVMMQVDALPASDVGRTSPGSLWRDAGLGPALGRDTRAFRTGDLMTVQLVESDAGTNSSTTDLNRTSTQQFGLSAGLGLEQANPRTGRFSLNQLLDATTNSSFAGDGQTQRSNTLSATLSVRVMRVLTNGDLVIAGEKEIMINRERQVLSIVGSVRAIDVDTNNQVASTKIANLVVRMWGRGEVDAVIRQGWFTRVIQRIWPF